MPRCQKGTRRSPPKTGDCHSAKNKTAKNKSSQPVTFNEFCKIAAELYGVTFSFCKRDVSTRNIYYSAKDKGAIVYPRELPMNGAPFPEDITRRPFTKRAIKRKIGITSDAIVH